MLNLEQMEALAKEIGAEAVMEQEYPQERSIWGPMFQDGTPDEKILAFAWSYL